jgi:hypothetical protein
MSYPETAKYGHHPDPLTDAEVEIDRLTGLLAETHRGLLRALDFKTATPDGISIKADVRDCLARTGFNKPLGEVGAPIPVFKMPEGWHGHDGSFVQ